MVDLQLFKKKLASRLDVRSGSFASKLCTQRRWENKTSSPEGINSCLVFFFFFCSYEISIRQILGIEQVMFSE